MFQMTQKLKTFKKYSTLSHQPGTPWGHTRNVHKLLSRGTFREKLQITKSSLLLVLPIKQTFDQNYTCSCVMKLCLTTTNGILETPIRTF